MYFRGAFFSTKNLRFRKMHIVIVIQRWKLIIPKTYQIDKTVGWFAERNSYKSFFLI